MQADPPAAGSTTESGRPVDIEKAFGRCVRRERLLQGLTQRELAQMLSERTDFKVDATAVTRLEQGQRALTLRQALAVTEVLNVENVELLFDESLYDQVTPEEMLKYTLERIETTRDNIATFAVQKRVSEKLLETLEQQLVELQAVVEGRDG